MFLGSGKMVGNIRIALLKSLSLFWKGNTTFQMQHLQMFLTKGRFLPITEGHWQFSSFMEHLSCDPNFSWATGEHSFHSKCFWFMVVHQVNYDDIFINAFIQRTYTKLSSRTHHGSGGTQGWPCTSICLCFPMCACRPVTANGISAPRAQCSSAVRKSTVWNAAIRSDGFNFTFRYVW